MKLVVMVAVVALGAGACAPKPALYAEGLNTTDPKFNSAECREIRLKALDFNNRVGSRVAIGLASGLLLGPFGLPIAIAADANVDQERRSFSREVHMRCSSLPVPDNLKKPEAAAPDATDPR